MYVKLRFALLLLAFLTPAVLSASPTPPTLSCSPAPEATLLTEILSPAEQPTAIAPEGLSPLDGAQSMTCGPIDCTEECGPCWNYYCDANGLPYCRCRRC